MLHINPDTTTHHKGNLSAGASQASCRGIDGLRLGSSDTGKVTLARSEPARYTGPYTYPPGERLVAAPISSLWA